MRVALLTVLVASTALAQSVDAWVHAKIAAQREALKPPTPAPLGPDGQMWKDAPPGRAVPGFVPPSSLAPLVKLVRGGVVSLGTVNEGQTLSIGSGFVVNPEGFVVTNNHVIEKARQIRARLADGRDLQAVVVGRDPQTDVALLRLIGAKNLPSLGLGDSDRLEVGDWVVAIGTPWGLENSVTQGIVSGRAREIGLTKYDEFIQTSASVYPGSSGGPLIDMHGNVVAVTTAQDLRGTNIAYAVPINVVKELLPNLLVNGNPERGWLGVTIDEEGDHAVVTAVTPGSPAEKVGLRAGDRVTSVDGRPVRTRAQMWREVTLQQPGSGVKLELSRDGKPLTVSVTLATKPTPAARYSMISDGRVDELGFALKPLGNGTLGLEPGVRIDALLPGGPAEVAGLATGDVIVELNREPVGSLKDIQALLDEAHRDEDVLLRIRRGQVLRYVSVRPVEP